MAEQDAELEARWSAWLLERNRRGLKISLCMAISLYPLFGILDYLTAPRAWLWLLFGTRAIVSVITLGMFWVLKSRIFDRKLDALSAGFQVLISVGISLMTLFMGGLASPYYAGLSLVMVAIGLLYVWPPVIVVVTHGAIIASFVISNVLLGKAGALLPAVSNQFFLVSTAIIVGTGQMFTYRIQREQVQNQLIIERTTKNLERAHDQLKQLDRFKSEFFANITHELKTPLTMMLAPLELMIDGQLGTISDAQRSTLLSVEKSGLKLLRLIGDLLDLSKLEESRLRLRVAEHDLAAHLRGLLSQAEPLAQRKALELRFTSSHEKLSLWYDFERIERVFVNLLSNATKFTPAGGSISVSLTNEGSSICLSVKDTGIGFPEDAADRIFQRFFQVDMAGTRRLGGAGIGLALAKELVELHSGEIWATSKPGAGATFNVRLSKGRAHFASEVLDRRGPPVDRAGGNRAADHGLAEWRLNETEKFRLLDIDQATEQRIIERDADEEQRPYSVLVVEDTPDVIRVIRLALHHDFRIFAAPNGVKGLELAQKHLPTLIITDLMMPELDGLELTRRLREDVATQHIPIVMLTARGGVDDRIAGLDVGVNAYLAKPFSVKELLSTVRSQLHAREVSADVLMTQKLDSLQTLAGGLAHQIKNPLNYIKSALASIERDSDKLIGRAASWQSDAREGPADAEFAAIAARMKKLFETAETGVRRIAATVELMVRYSREGYTRTAQPYDVYAAVKDVLGLLLPSAGFELEVKTDLHGEGRIQCVPEEFNQVLTNLLENALHALPSDGTGRIWIKGENQGPMLELSVRDNGVGIAPEDQARIFTAFYTTKDVGRGMGLGLTIVWRVVTALGGTIHVHSQVGAGSEFVMRVPRVLAKPERSGYAAASAMR